MGKELSPSKALPTTRQSTLLRSGAEHLYSQRGSRDGGNSSGSVIVLGHSRQARTPRASTRMSSAEKPGVPELNLRAGAVESAPGWGAPGARPPPAWTPTAARPTRRTAVRAMAHLATQSSLILWTWKPAVQDINGSLLYRTCGTVELTVRYCTGHDMRYNSFPTVTRLGPRRRLPPAPCHGVATRPSQPPHLP